MLYSSLDNKKIKYIKKLNNKKYREQENLFLVEGEHLVKEAYKNNYLKEIILEEGYSIDVDVDKIFVTSSILKNISTLESYPKVIGVCKKLEKKPLGNKILLLDNIQDPGNLGTIIRSSVAFNIDTVVLGGDCVDLYNSKVIRSTQGMIFNVNIIREDLTQVISNLKQLNYKIYGTKVNGGKSLKNVEKVEKFAIIMGNEGQGVKNSLLEMCSDYIHIDMNSSCESLNVAVATSIILYELDK